MNTYDAIMRAADHIEKNPQLYDFHVGNHPDDKGVGCGLAWIGYFMGVEKDIDRIGFFPEIYANTVAERLTGSDTLKSFFDLVGCGICRSDEAPRLLRAYAEKYQSRPKAERDAFRPWLASLMAKVEGDPIPA